MSGHSKWANIKSRKGAQDKKRSEAFTKLSKNIMTAIRSGGGNANPEANMGLKVAIEKARGSNMPKENIERLLVRFEERKNNLINCLFEGFGPQSVPLMVEVETDNKNRIISEIKNIFKVNGGNLGENGSVAYLFDRVGEIEIENLTPEAEFNLIEVDGIIDFGEGVVFTKSEMINEVLGKIQQRGLVVGSHSIILKVRMPVILNSEDEVAKVLDLIEELEELDDVMAVYSGFDLKI